MCYESYDIEFRIYEMFYLASEKKKKIRWACGVIMFTLLVGCPPFWHRKQMVMLRNIMEGKYSFTSPEWADISGEKKKKQKKYLIFMMNSVFLKKNLPFVLQRTQKISLESVWLLIQKNELQSKKLCLIHSSRQR